MRRPAIHPFHTSLLFLLTATCLSHSASAQDLDWGKLSLFGQLQWEMPTREFGEYWKNGPGIGIAGTVPLDDPFLLGGTATFSWFGRGETEKKERIPDVILFRLGAAIHAVLFSSDQLSARLGLGLDNHSFIFVGNGAPDDIDNIVELELGVNVSVTLVPGFVSHPPPEILFQHHTIFTGPDRVGVFLTAIAIPL